jgi:hypothetical protein
LGRDPGRDQSHNAEVSDDDGASTVDGLRDVSGEGSTNSASDLHVDGATSGITPGRTLADDGEGWEGIPSGRWERELRREIG